jgi:hypothetical protein
MKTRIVLLALAAFALPWIATAEMTPAGTGGLAADPAAPAVTAAAVQPAAALASATAPAPPAPRQPAATPAVEPPLEPLFLADGCTAEQICVHQPPATVSCSGPPGTSCSSSWQGCGLVTCNGVTTRCPGSCVGDHHCFNFCWNTYGSLDGFCNFGCCQCL